MLSILVVAHKWGNSKKQPKRNPKTIAKNVMADKWANAKSNQNPSKNDERSLKVGSGGSRGRLADQFGPRAAQGSKRAPKSRENLFRF